MPENEPISPLVVKVGGSLFTMAELGPRLAKWLKELSATGKAILLVPGGGSTADLVREWDGLHMLGEEPSHWLALHALSLNARLLNALLPGTCVVETLEECQVQWREETIPILDPYSFLRSDEGQPGCLPHTWSFTSDSIAARVAIAIGAGELILLKSATMPEGVGWRERSRLGFVDPLFSRIVDSCSLPVRAINFRKYQP
jgi:aspartokinase-like uncharacterized kinase